MQNSIPKQQHFLGGDVSEINVGDKESYMLVEKKYPDGGYDKVVFDMQAFATFLFGKEVINCEHPLDVIDWISNAELDSVHDYGQQFLKASGLYIFPTDEENKLLKAQHDREQLKLLRKVIATPLIPKKDVFNLIANATKPVKYAH